MGTADQPELPLKPGDVIRVEEPDYMYGLGTLILRIVAVGKTRQIEGDAWINLRAMPLRSDGIPLQAQSRYALVRVTGIRRVPTADIPDS
jgi:hypothetical protein